MHCCVIHAAIFFQKVAPMTEWNREINVFSDEMGRLV